MARVGRALLYDGLTARGRQTVAEYSPDGVELQCEDGVPERLPLALLSRGTMRDGRVTIHRDDAPDWRLVLHDPPADWLLLLRPIGQPARRTIVAYAAVGAMIVAAVIGLWLSGGRLLDLAAPMVPHRLTEPIGRAVVGELGGKSRCAATAGQKALDRLVDRLRPAHGFVEPVRVIVADVPVVNAFAAPGGQVVIFDGLIDRAQSGDEVAGVLAHELTHVQLRHPTKALLRQTGLSMLIQSVAGDVGHFADMALMLQGSREAERAADAGALDLLRQARISPAGFADFFKRMEMSSPPAKKPDKSVALIEKLGNFAATHPGGAERITAIEKVEAEAWPATPAMTDEDWKALRAICDRTEGDDE